MTLKSLNNKDGEYLFFKKNNETENENYHSEVYFPKKKQEIVYTNVPKEMPPIVTLFIGGVSVIGLYMVFRFIEKK